MWKISLRFSFRTRKEKEVASLCIAATAGFLSFFVSFYDQVQQLKPEPKPQSPKKLLLKSRHLVIWKPVFSRGDRCCGRRWHIRHGRAGGGLWRALVGPQENFVLGGHFLPPALLVGQEFLETGGCKGESLPTKAHQVGILKPGVIEAVLNGGTSPDGDQRDVV